MVVVEIPDTRNRKPVNSQIYAGDPNTHLYVNLLTQYVFQKVLNHMKVEVQISTGFALQLILTKAMVIAMAMISTWTVVMAWKTSKEIK